jgi:hypothetical protein
MVIIELKGCSDKLGINEGIRNAEIQTTTAEI